jgi:hypothetical protein
MALPLYEEREIECPKSRQQAEAGTEILLALLKVIKEILCIND